MTKAIHTRFWDWLKGLFGKKRALPDRREFLELLGILKEQTEETEGDAKARGDDAYDRFLRAEKRRDRHVREARDLKAKGEKPEGARLRKLAEEIAQTQRKVDSADAEMDTSYRTRELAATMQSLMAQIREKLNAFEYDVALQVRAKSLRGAVKKAAGGLIPLEQLRGIFEDLQEMAREMELEVRDMDEIMEDAHQARVARSKKTLDRFLEDEPAPEAEAEAETTPPEEEEEDLEITGPTEEIEKPGEEEDRALEPPT